MNNINDIIAVSGILLTLSTFLFNIAWSKIKNVLDLDEYVAGDKERKKRKDLVRNTIFSTVFPIFLGFLCLFYINLPSACLIIKSSDIDLWYFDVDKTLYIMVVFSLLCFLVFNGYLLIRLIKKYLKI